MLGLEFGNMECDLWHGDLHGNNALIKWVSNSEFWLKYYRKNNEVINIKSDGCITVLIDFGSMHIKTNDGFHMAQPDSDASYVKDGRVRDVNFPLYDAYRLLSYALFNARYDNLKVYNDLIDLIKFFTNDDPFEFIRVNNNLPPLPSYFETNTSSPLHDFIDYCIDHSIALGYNITSPTVSRDKLYLECFNECPTFESVISDVGLDKLEQPESFYDLVNIYTKYPERHFIDKFPLKEALTSEIEYF